MRTFAPIAILVLAVALLAGCTSPNNEPSDDGNLATAGRVLVAPAPANYTQAVDLSFTSTPFGQVEPDFCARPNVQCFTYNFTVAEPAGTGNITGNLTVVGDLSWGSEQSGFQLQLRDATGEILAEHTVVDVAAPATSAHVEAEKLTPGEYFFRVAAYRAYDETFVLKVTFALELPAPPASS